MMDAPPHQRWDDEGRSARRWNRAALKVAFRSHRELLADFLRSLAPRQLSVPCLPTINPPLWEVAHVAWFDEWFCVRSTGHPPRWPEADPWLDSSRIPHDARWKLPELTLGRVIDFLEASLDDALTVLNQTPENDAELEPFRLAVFHQAMHLEALAWLAHTLSWPAPPWVRPNAPGPASEPVTLPACREQSITQEAGFAFDNEAHARYAIVGEVRIGALVRTAEFAHWIESGGYRRATGHVCPAHWRRGNDGVSWEHRSFDRWLPCNDSTAMVHANAYEAEAYCRDQGGRLPTEGETFFLLTGRDAPVPPDTGTVWEWTASTFAPFPGFRPGLYTDYSAPSFDGRHRVLKGASYAALPLIAHPHYRNFFRAERADIFAGFRVAFPS